MRKDYFKENDVLVETDQFIIKLASNEREIAAAQRLRFQMFYEERQIQPDGPQAFFKRDFDHFDPFCDHLIVISKTGNATDLNVVGTYRLLKENQAKLAGGFITSAEFNLNPLENFAGKKVELGRACVHPDFRSKAVMQLLWRGIAAYIQMNKIDLMMGAASFPGTNPEDFALALAFLHFYHRAPSEWRPKAHPHLKIDLRTLKRKHLDLKAALQQMPPLLKGYLRVGAVIGDGAVIDWKLETVDVCLMVDTSLIAERYKAHYMTPQPEIEPQTGVEAR